jgi:hypothetical protein
MKTLAISTLALFAIACAPDASLQQDASADIRMDEMVEASLDDILARTEGERRLLRRARKDLREIQEDMVESGAEVVGMIRGTFDDDKSTFKAVAYDSAGRPFFYIQGEYTWTAAPMQERILTGVAISTMTEKSGEMTRTEGTFEGATLDESYYGQQIFEGIAPMFHEGIWLVSPDRTTGHLIGLVGRTD